MLYSLFLQSKNKKITKAHIKTEIENYDKITY